MAFSDDRDERDRSTADAAWTIVSHTVAGILLYGGIGWLLSLWLGHRALFVGAGVIIGVALSLYLVHARLANDGGGPGSDGGGDGTPGSARTRGTRVAKRDGGS